MAPNQKSYAGKLKGTILLTGANGSLACPFVQKLLEANPEYFLLLTVRDASASDSNTQTLRNIVAKFPSANASIEALDQGSLQEVKAFSQNVARRVAEGEIPTLSAVKLQPAPFVCS